MAKSFGDAFVIDLETRAIRCLTCNVPGAAFLRVMHLPSSDYLLIGPERFVDLGRSRCARQRAVVPEPEAGVAAGEARPPHERGRGRLEAIDEDRLLGRPRAGPRDPGGPDAPRRRRPRRLGRDARRCAASASSSRATGPAAASRPRTSSTTTASSPTAATSRRAARASGPSTSRPASGRTSRPRSASTTRSRASSPTAGTPASRATTSRARSATRPASATSTSGSSASTAPAASFTRLTTFNDHEGWKASNPVVSTDGRLMAFQVGAHRRRGRRRLRPPAAPLRRDADPQPLRPLSASRTRGPS